MRSIETIKSEWSQALTTWAENFVSNDREGQRQCDQRMASLEFESLSMLSGGR